MQIMCTVMTTSTGQNSSWAADRKLADPISISISYNSVHRLFRIYFTHGVSKTWRYTVVFHNPVFVCLLGGWTADMYLFQHLYWTVFNAEGLWRRIHAKSHESGMPGGTASCEYNPLPHHNTPPNSLIPPCVCLCETKRILRAQLLFVVITFGVRGVRYCQCLGGTQ
jgi:hypothetical protein